MKYLLDTGIWLWSTNAPEKIAVAGRSILEAGTSEIYLSAVVSLEISIKMRLGKLDLPSPPGQCIPAFMAKQGLRPLPITHIHAVKTYELAPHHKDPFDRLLISQAMAEGMTILTADRAFRKYPVELVWCGK